MSRSLVIGVNGQDGSYLAEALLQRGHEVLGCGRGEMSRYVKPVPGFTYEKVDLRDLASLEVLLQCWELDFAFHFAAVHGAAGFEYEEEWRDMMTVNVLSMHALLEHARRRAPAMRILYGGSAKIFPAPLTGTIDEATPARATCLYSIGKIASRDLIFQYREKHGVAATNLVLFNHESIRRPPNYFLPTIARSIASAKTNPSFRSSVKTLDFWIDWSAADEFMEIAIDIAEQSNIAEVILASGKTWHGRAAVEHLFARHDLDFRNHIIETLPHADFGPGPEFHVDIGQLMKASGRRPMKSLSHVFDQMIDAVIEARPAKARSG
jgi:GDPmannose 4,6-dehydratase